MKNKNNTPLSKWDFEFEYEFISKELSLLKERSSSNLNYSGFKKLSGVSDEREDKGWKRERDG